MKSRFPAILLALSTLPMLLCMAEPNQGIPRVERLKPRGGQQGQEVTLVFSGQLLNTARGLWSPTLSGLNFVSCPVPSEPSTGGNTQQKFAAKVTLPKDTPAGIHSIRLQTEGGLSEPIPFSVGTLPEVSETDTNQIGKTDTNNTSATAQAITLGQTINGFIAGADTDCFQFTVKKGQRITAELECFRLAMDIEDGTEVEISLTDSRGKTLATCDDTPLFITDPFFSLLAPADDTLTLTVKSILPPVQARSVPYRLQVGSFLRPAALLPAGGKPGATEKVQVLDENGKVLQTLDLTWPTMPTSGMAYAKAQQETANGNPVHLLDGPNYMETEPNETPDSLTTPPAASSFACNGIISKSGDVDCFRFTAEKDKRYLVSVFAQSLGSTADMVLLVGKLGQKGGQKSDDVTDNELDKFEACLDRRKLDPRMLFVPKESGEYVLTLRDTRDMGGPLFFYRVEVQPAAEGVLIGFSGTENNVRLTRSVAQVAQGSTSVQWLTNRLSFGTEKLTGEYELQVEGLPPGVEAISDKFKFDKKKIPVTFKAAADAPLANSNLTFRLKPLAPEKPTIAAQFRQMVGQTFINNDISMGQMFESLAYVTVGAAPFQISVKPPDAPLSKNGEILLEINLQRQPGYEKEVEVLLENPPTGIQPTAGFRIPKNATTASFRLGGDYSINAGKYPIRLTARQRTDDNSRMGRIYASSNEIEIEVTEPYLKAQLPRTSLEQGKAETVALKLTKIRPWPEGATLNLIRLPKGVTMDKPVELPNNAETINLPLLTAADALVGTYNSLALEVTFQINGRELKQMVGGGTIRIDPARK